MSNTIGEMLEGYGVLLPQDKESKKVFVFELFSSYPDKMMWLHRIKVGYTNN
jgi:hypothetical protein